MAAKKRILAVQKICRPRADASAFTILELLVVIAIIIALAGLILGTVGYVQKKGARSRAEAEIAALSAALESYKADNGAYPGVSPPNPDTNALDPATDVDPASTAATKYSRASLYLYKELSGDHNGDRVVDDSDKATDSDGKAISPPLTSLPKSYLPFKPSNLLPAPPSTIAVTAIADPFGNSYGYSTAKATNPGGTTGYNPTFDLWSTAGGKTQRDIPQWIKNW